MNAVPTSWNLQLIFKDESEIEKARQEAIDVTDSFVKKWQDKNDYLENPASLKEALDDYNSWAGKYGDDAKEYYYYSLQQSLDQDNPDLKAKMNKARDIALKLANEIQFFELRLAKISEEKQKLFLDDKNLQGYHHFLEKLFEQARHNLTEPEEKIMNLKSSTSYVNWIQMLEEFLAKSQREVLDSEGKREIKSFSDIIALMNNKSKEIRDTAADAFNDIVKTYLDVAEHEINSVLDDKKTNDTLRHFDRPDSVRHMNDDIETEVVDTVIKTVSSNYEISRRYYALKAKLMGVAKLAYHERNVEYGEIDKKYEYYEATDIINNVFSNLDKEFADIYQDFLQQGRIDAFPKKGKTGGAYATHNLITEPTYLLLNFTGQLVDILTMAHELGHGINYELVRKKQNAINFGTTISTTEVASTFMEDFVVQELMKNAGEELQLALLMMRLNDQISTIFRQAAFYQFEWDLHKSFREKGYLSKEEIGSIFQKYMMDYMGEAVSYDPGSENWWTYISHFRMFFYVYSYASGLLISKALQAKVKKDHQFIEKVKVFLSTGLSESPKAIFNKLGIDITKKEFWEAGIREIEATLEETENLAKKLGKI